MTHHRINEGRRDEDRCWARRVYSLFTPYVQIGGWLAVAVPIFVLGYVLAQKAEAFDSRLTMVESAQRDYAGKQEIITTKLDTVIYFVRKK